jgi:hypothetical protein
MISKVISGGQTGVEQAALRAAKAAGIPTGGYTPKMWMTEDGPNPSLAEYGLIELETPDYPRRTRAVVDEADAVLILSESFPRELQGGSAISLALARDKGKPFRNVHLAIESGFGFVLSWVRDQKKPFVLMVTGPRESNLLGIGAKAERFLTRLFAELKTAKCDLPESS